MLGSCRTLLQPVSSLCSLLLHPVVLHLIHRPALATYILRTDLLYNTGKSQLFVAQGKPSAYQTHCVKQVCGLVQTLMC